MPVLGFGVYRIPPDETERAVTDALAAGYRLIDTATVYGNEEAVGRAVKNSGVPRGDLFVTTKVRSQDAGRTATRAAFEASLERLGLDRVDLYLIHQPSAGHHGSWEAMQELHGEGLIAAVGVSNFLPDQVGELIRQGGAAAVPVVDQIENHPYYQRSTEQDSLARQGVLVQAWAPFAAGRHGLFGDSTLRATTAAYGRSVAQVVLRWQIQRGVATVAKSVCPERMRENTEVFDFTLSDDDMGRIAALDTGTSVFGH
jgi:2,5-diketo-D-gluconate reductase A